MRRIRKLISNFLVCILCMTTFITQIHMVNAEEIEDAPTEEVVQETTPETSEVQEVQDVPQTTEKLDEYYKDGKILIYNYEQLKQIGSDAFIYTKDKDGNIGTGDIVVNEGTQLTYGKDAQYLLMNEIKMDTKSIWNVKDDFTGKIEGEAIKEDETPTLYDKKTDTIYIYNPYQLMVLEKEDSDKEPVMSLDYDAPQFGMGQMIYPNGEDKDYLTYSKDHNYVISKNFSSDKPELVADQLSIDPDTTDTEGRDFKGQVVKTIGDKTYILIGNEEQLRSIGTDKDVHGAIYQAYEDGLTWKIDTDKQRQPIMLYGGDADLKQEQNGKQDFIFGTVLDTNKKISNKSAFHIRGKCGVDQTTGKIDPNLDIDKQTQQKYTKNANYIIFRDIDLSSTNWNPLTFQGTMIGAKSVEKGGLWKDGVINTIDKPVISNVTINQSTKINVGEQMGVGFFSTISSEVSEKDIGLSKGLVKVSNIQFDNLKVHTTTNETYYPPSLVSTLTNTLGKLLGGLLSGLTFILTFGQVKIDLGKTLGDVLDARKKDPTALSTGAIAGRVEGQVEISNIEVNNANVKNVNGYTGGFVGYAVGTTQYDGLSNALGDLVKLLTNILNVIPGLGLGDLIKILLGNAIPLGKLIPTGYINPKIVNCNINSLTISTASDKEYAGGFIGMQKGAIVESCSVTGGSNTISGKNFVGGFVGLARDDVIEGTLSGALDIETKLPKMNTESLLLNCSLNNAVVSVSGESYIGGFAGGLANASTVNCNVKSDNALTVTASGNYAGGFAGIASLGWAADLGKDDTKDNLLGGVVDLVVRLLSSNPGAASSLLSLAGVNPSHILGCSVNASLQVSGKDYVGGITGRGNGAYIAQSNADNLQKISYWKNNLYDVGSVSVLGVSLTGLSNIKGNDYVGGIAGSMGTASVAGLLNTTLGVASYLAFTVDNVYISGNGLKIEGNERVGGGLGDALGGSIKTVNIDNLNSVEGNNYVGGFIGLSGPGDLAGTDGGLTVNLLGLNYVLKLSNLLSLGQAIEVKINEVNVRGSQTGFTVHAKGSREGESVRDYCASGFIAKSGSTKVDNSNVSNLKSVQATDNGGYASGFVAISKTGGLAEVADDTSIKSLIEANGLVNAVGYLIPRYTNCTVSFVNGGSVTADVAGGFAADFQSGTVDNSSRGENDYYAVYNLDSVNGQSYAGGFGGNVYSGALADAGKGISVLGNINGLNINIGELLNLVNAYVPIIKYAGVKSDNGFTVSANKIKSDDTNSGSAGGFIGYGSGVQVSHCDVTNLKHTKVTPPKDLEGEDSSNYFSQESTYAVTGARYAGGYIGYMNIGSAASVGKGLSVLGKTIGLNDVLDALNVVVSTIEHSNVTGGPSGFAVKASMKNTASDASADDVLGDAGGFAGKISGGHIQNSNSYNFSYIIGQITAGGYVGDLQPGSVADALGGTSILGGLVNTKETLASLAQDFVPTIRNSSTTCIPCGGAVRADASSTTTTQRGMAGGYAGHNEGGHIWGNNTYKWKGQDYTGPISTCKAVRIRSVFGEEIAGGFTGLMESADTAKAGSLSLLWGLVKADNILGALSVVYPTEENTAVYGPLALMDLKTWNSWVEHVGKYGGYGSDFSNLVQSGKINTQGELDAILAQYVYGYNVVAGRSDYQDETNLSKGGAAGGYVGSMLTGTITNAQAHDTKLVKGLRCAGGFAGEMINGGAANLGGVDILGLKLPLSQMLDVLNVFVPVIKQSSVEGYQSGLMVQSNGNNDKDLLGYAGGYVGKLIGGQIWGDDTLRCKVTKLRRVDGTSYVGGFVGSSRPGSVATVDPVRGEGLLSKLLGTLLKTPTDLIKVLNATVATIRYADVEAWNDWGVIVNGAYDSGGNNTSYAKAAGGFAGMLEGTVLGKKDEDLAGVTAQNIRSVVAGEYAGGCFGISDVAGVANISAGSETSLLDKLLKLGRADVLDAFRSYVYNGNVSGSKDAGLSVSANVANKYDQNNEVTYSGTAGGFGGSLLNGSVKNSTVTNLSNVRGLNSVGGFVGYSGKSGVVGVDKIDVLGDNTGQLLGGALGVMDIFGSHIDDSTVTGINGGYTVQSTGGEEQIASGFIGYANLARISNCTAGAKDASFGLKQVTSDGTAGGFAGRTSYAYLADVKLDSGPANVLFAVVNRLIKALYLDKIQDSNLLKINLGLIKVDALYDGNLIHVNILGLDISVGLSKKSKDNDQQTDLAIITIGDSSIKLPCDENGLLNDNDAKSNISVNLIKANRTKITDSKVYGISSGYDVYAGGADNNKDGNAEDGRSGGFVGFNDEGLLKNNDMYLCDVVRGTSKMVGPFSGQSDLNSVYEFNTQEKVEGVSNNYRIYRKLDKALDEIVKNTTKLNMEYSKDSSTGWNIYTLGHFNTIKSYDTLQNAKITNSNGSENVDLNAYESDAKAVLMSDTKTNLNTGESDTPEPSESQDPCDEKIKLTINKVWKDWNNFSGIRPKSITVTISRTWTDASSTKQTASYESYIIEGNSKSTWKKVIEGLPAYIKDGDKICYYTYSVTETEINGYTTTIKTSKDGFTFTITNQHFPGLPDTGGNGRYLIYLIGLLLLAIYLVTGKKRNKKNQLAEKL